MAAKTLIDLRYGDCLDLLRGLADASVDFTFYDPPYNIKKDYGQFKDNLPPEQYREWMANCITEAKRVSRRGIAVYVGGKLTRLFSELLPEAHLIIVHKRAVGAMAGNYFLQYHSLFSTAKPIAKTKDLWDDIRLPGEGYFFREPRYKHPGFTSLALTEKILRTFTLEGETVLDCFAGVGTTPVACVNLKRGFVGAEISPDYFAVAQERITSAQIAMESIA